jgi:hypothetical protein
LDIFQASGKIEQVSTVLNVCVTHVKIDGNINRRNLIEIPASPTASDLMPRIASITSLSVKLEKENSSSWPQSAGVPPAISS